MKRNIFLISFISLAATLFAQEPISKANYELAERFSPKKVSKMVFSTSIDPHFLKNSTNFWYAYETPKGKFWYIVDGVTGKKQELFDRNKMAADVTLIVKDPFDAEHLPIENIRFKESNKSFIFEVKSKYLKTKEINKDTEKEEEKPKVFFMEYNIDSKSVVELKDYKKEEKIPSWASISPNKENVLFARSDFNLYTMDWENFEKAVENEKDSTIVETQITFDGSYDYPWGGSNYGKNNVEIKKDAKKRKSTYAVWSPDSKNFAIVRTDVTNVNDFWVINSLSAPRPTLETYKYHMAGEAKAPIPHLFVCDIATKKMKEINVDRFKDQTIKINYAPQLKSNRDDRIKTYNWLGDNSSFIMHLSSRDLKRIDICRINISTDSVQTLIKDRLNVSLETRTPHIVEGSGDIIQWSERNGWAQLYLHNKDGQLKNKITEGAFNVDGVVGVDSKNKVVYFNAYGVNKEENPYYRHLYRINFDGTNMKLLNKTIADNTSILSDDNRFFINTSSEVNRTPLSELISTTGQQIKELEKTDLSILMSAGYKFPEMFKAKADDGITDIYGVMYKPFDFDSTKVYPIIAYVYPGPQTEAMNTQFSERMDRIDRLAQLGFIVVTLGNRGGHPNRSKWYHTYGYGNLRDYGLADKKTVLQQLAYRHTFIDIDKVGIHGHSGGGFMSTAAILVYPDFFKVAVSSAGNHENNIYNRWWSEKHHGVEEVISEKGDSTTFKYSIDRNSDIAKNLKGKLLLVTGDQDNNVHPANTARVANALIRANKRFDMIILPGQRHGFGDMTEYFFWRMADYFSEHLIGDSEDNVNIVQMNR